MAYYKVLKDNVVIDVLDRVNYVKYQEKHNLMILCEDREAQGFLSSDCTKVFHDDSLITIPVEGYDTVERVEIDFYEYERLKALNYKTAEEIIDAYTLILIEGGLL